MASLAKRFEEVFLPGQADPIRLPRQSEALYLLQRIRDESHRFAITYHRQLRDKRMTKSVLDGIPGLGETRRKRLLKELGGVRAVQEASLDDLKALSWLPDTVAEAVHAKVHRRRAGSLTTRRHRSVRARDQRPPTSPMAGSAADARRPLGGAGGWWQDGFTEGADEEYVEQIMPLAARWLDGHDRVLDVGTRRGPGRPSGRRRGARPPWSASTRRRAQIGEAAPAAAGRRYAVGRRRRPAVRATGRSTRWSPAWCSSTSSRSTPPCAEVARVLRPGGRFAFFLNHPLLQTPNSGWIDDHVLDPPEQYWRIGPYLQEDLTLEEVEKGVLIPFVHRPLGALRQRHGGRRAAACGHMEEPAAAAGFLARSPEYPQGADYPRLAACLRGREGAPTSAPL